MRRNGRKSRSITNDKFRIHLITGNGMCRNQQGGDGPKTGRNF
jgi:hypothetical protein